MAASGSILGNPVRRTEDPRILRGDAGYFDDLEVEGLLHVTFVRSTMAHARIEAVDAAEMVIVDYDPLETVVDPEAALADDAPAVFPEHGSNLAIEFNFGEDLSILDD